MILSKIPFFRTAEKEIKLTNALISYVIPDDEMVLVEQNCSFNQMTGDWELRCVAYTGNNMKVSSRTLDSGFLRF